MCARSSTLNIYTLRWSGAGGQGILRIPSLLTAFWPLPGQIHSPGKFCNHRDIQTAAPLPIWGRT